MRPAQAQAIPKVLQLRTSRHSRRPPKDEAPKLGAGDVHNHAALPFPHIGNDGLHCAHRPEEVGFHQSTSLVDTVVFEDSTRREASIVNEDVDRSMLGHSLIKGGLQVRTGNVKCDPLASKLLDLCNGFGRLRRVPG